MKKIKLTFLFIVLLGFYSCNDDLDKHCGEIVVSKTYYLGGGPYYLHLKKPGGAKLKELKVSVGEYDYYKKGDTIKCR